MHEDVDKDGVIDLVHEDTDGDGKPNLIHEERPPTGRAALLEPARSAARTLRCRTSTPNASSMAYKSRQIPY